MPEYKTMRAEGKRVGCNQDSAVGRQFAGIVRGSYKKDWVGKLQLFPCYFVLMTTKEDSFLKCFLLT
jgi:hypothetical protein